MKLRSWESIAHTLAPGQTISLSFSQKKDPFSYYNCSFPLLVAMSQRKNATSTSKHAYIKQFVRDWFANIKIPPFETWRKPVKQALAMMIASIMTLSDNCRNSIGQGSLLCAIVIVFFFPARTFGVVFEVSKHRVKDSGGNGRTMNRQKV